jgi:serine/threonine protein kinase
MGVVYHAFHRSLRKEIAVKVILSQKADDLQAVERFEREMAAVGNLDHPHIVRALDAGDVNGTRYLAMEFVKGINLQQLLRECGQLAIADACELVRQAALGLQHVHESGLVHRDIKPSNLLLSSKGIVKVSDLGLARLTTRSELSDEESQDPLTEIGCVLGTFDFMAPEQARSSRTADIRADIYSLGCTLHMLLTGRPPFPAPEFATPASKLAAHAITQPVSALTFRPELPQGLDTLLAKTMAKDPEKRFASPADFAQSIAPFAEGSDLAKLAAIARIEESYLPAVQDDSILNSQTSTEAHATNYGRAATSCTVQLVRPTTPWRWIKLRWVLVAIFITAVLASAAFWYPGKADLKNEHDSKPSTSPTGTANSQEQLWRTVFRVDAADRDWPRDVAWRGFLGIGAHTFRDSDDVKALEISSDQIRLLKLGDLGSGGARVQVNFRQALWKGGCGLFFGCHLETIRGVDCTTFLLVSLERKLHPDRGPEFFIQVAKMYILPRTGSPHILTLLAEQPISQPNLLNRFPVEVIIQDHQLQVSSGELRFEVPSVAAAILEPRDFEGSFGIYSEDGVLWCRDPVFQEFPSGAKE